MEVSCAGVTVLSHTAKSQDSADPKAMELSHTAVRAKIQKAPSATNMPACLKLSTSALPMMQCAITAREKKKKKGHSQCVCPAYKAECGVGKKKKKIKKNPKLVFFYLFIFFCTLCDI